MKTAFIILIVTCIGSFLCSCDDKLDIQQAYDFSLSTMPVQSV